MQTLLECDRDGIALHAGIEAEDLSNTANSTRFWTLICCPINLSRDVAHLSCAKATQHWTSSCLVSTIASENLVGVSRWYQVCMYERGEMSGVWTRAMQDWLCLPANTRGILDAGLVVRLTQDQ